MSQPATAVLEVEKIDVQDGLNPRTRFDEDRLAELEASIRQDGLVTALTVVPAKADRYTVIAGERRLIAAKRAGLKEVPVVVRSVEGSRAATLVENLIREDLDPIDTAQGLADLAQAENLSTHQQIAERIGRKKSVGWVSEHLRLLRLPEGVQRHIASGEVPVAAEKALRKAATVSPRIAECACELVARGTIDGRDIVDHFGEVLQQVAEASFTEKPTMIGVRSGAPLSELIADAGKRNELMSRIAAVSPYLRAEDPVIRFGEAEVDAARAAGCLLEHRVDQDGWVSVVAYVTDADFAADLTVRVIEGMERRAAECKAQAAKAGDADSNGANPERARDARQEERLKAKRCAEAARDANLELGRNLIKRRGSKSRRERSLARAKALAAVVLADNEELGAAGLRLVFPQLQDVEVKRLKSGEPREKVSYADREQCASYLSERIEKARSANEVLELLADALIAVVLADEEELPRSRRIRCHLGAEDAVKKLLASDIKAVRPRRRRIAAK
jgi:ParB/RepB/Spo0J family partition protein